MRNIKQDIGSLWVLFTHKFYCLSFHSRISKNKKSDKIPHSSRCFCRIFKFQISTRNCIFGAIKRVVVKQALKAAEIKSVFMNYFSWRSSKMRQKWTKLNLMHARKIRKKNKFPRKIPLWFERHENALAVTQSQRNAR